MSNSNTRDIAIVIHGAFQSNKNVEGAALVLRDLGVKIVHTPDLAGHGAERDVEISGKHLTERLAENLLSRREIKHALDADTIGKVTLIGHSLGASVAIAAAKQLIIKAESLNLILVEPIFWLGKKCVGQDDLLKNLETHIPRGKTQVEITNYLRSLLTGETGHDCEISTLSNLATSDRCSISLVRGGRTTVRSKGGFKIDTSEGVIDVGHEGQEIGSLVPNDYCNRNLFDSQISIKEAGHNPFAHSSFYKWLRLLLNQDESLDEDHLLCE